MSVQLPFGHKHVTTATILCCNCGVPIPAPEGSAPALCYDCIKLSADITDGIPREGTLHYCKNCERYLQPPSAWVAAPLESRELLSLCLRKLRGLNKVRLIDAGFIWTEPHSRRVKVKLTVQKEAFTSTIIQQTFEVEYTIAYQQCLDCAKIWANNTWKAMVQIRQKVNHKRTFLYLEQLILKHHAHKDTTNIKEVKDGLDFYYGNRNQAERMLEFLAAVAPITSKKSEELISMDTHTSVHSYKFTFSVELPRVTKDQLICLPRRLAQSMGNMVQLCLCSRMGTNIEFLDPNTLQTGSMTAATYWYQPFESLADIGSMVEYTVLDVELLGPTHKRWALADVQVMRTSDMGNNDDLYIVRSHLGGILNPGDTVMGYHLVTSNFNNDDYDKLKPEQIPDIILVKKSYPNARRKNRGRNWKLKRIAKEESEMAPRKQDKAKQEADYEAFLRDLEEDAELRQTVNVYKDQEAQARKTLPVEDVEMESDGEVEEDFPEIPVDELLSAMDNMTIDAGAYDNGEEGDLAA
ncbi:60S ribosomal export protein nmd3 [Saitoella complicata NRRL Y-17804]|uniref:60S ribosomal export protein NMD3 n=1 Tax=Saitoella complicata (strain BCRC 22490 / CBS 7301 / JCM 7358 / NBRC 10748 / NRRL Y-17804) TaxID=698492 RepID=A0A0E9NHS1_SAICN|nr:60S ribosomal export protein nmd3 [Saitoella complicata NRRL Y-17804]ODQ56067.1 60S ribosomal export protein nmd3 [Saitoella complicata NRRL Y-17804]GAO49412.1 hypothetical protein G7K_3562-t1 [Saitoella complicata NRRL Y-17804]